MASPWSRRSSPSTSRSYPRSSASCCLGCSTDARNGLTIPRIALRHRLQHDVHGLDRSRHRVLGEDGHLVVELDRHGAATPQVLGAVMAAAALRDRVGVRCSTRSGGSSTGAGPASPPTWNCESCSTVSRRCRRPSRARVGTRRAAAKRRCGGASPRRNGGPWRCSACGSGWRWSATTSTAASDACSRDAHPDSGGVAAQAAMRIEELSEARAILLDVASDDVAAEG